MTLSNNSLGLRDNLVDMIEVWDQKLTIIDNSLIGLNTNVSQIDRKLQYCKQNIDISNYWAAKFRIFA